MTQSLCKNYTVTVLDYVPLVEQYPYNQRSFTKPPLSLLDSFKTVKRYKTYDREAILDNIKTTHEYVNKYMTSLHLWGKNIHYRKDSFDIISKDEKALLQVLKDSRCVVIAFRSSAAVWHTRSLIEKLVLVAPLAILLLLQIGIPTSQSPQILTEINSGFHRSIVQHMVLPHVNKEEQLDHLTRYITELCLEENYDKIMRRHYQFLLRNWFPFWVARSKQMYNEYEVYLLRQAFQFVNKMYPNKKLLHLQNQVKQLQASVPQ
jgi:hypothetical protein